MISGILTSEVGPVLIGGFDSTDFGDRSIEERDFGTGEDGFGAGEVGFGTGEGDPESDLVDPFLAILLILGVADAVFPFKASDRPDLLNVRNIKAFLHPYYKTTNIRKAMQDIQTQIILKGKPFRTST